MATRTWGMLVASLLVVLPVAEAPTAQAAQPSDKPQVDGGSNGDAPSKPPAIVDLKGHGGPVKALALSTDGARLLSGSFDYAAMLWRLDATPARPARRLTDFDGAVNAVAFASGRHVFAGDDGMLRIADAETGAFVARVDAHQHKINDLDVSAEGTRVVTASWDRTARITAIAEPETGLVLDGHRGPVNAAVFTHDGRAVITASSDGRLRRFNAETGTLDRVTHNHGWGLNVLTRVPGGHLIAFGATDGAVGLIDGRTGDVVKTLAKHEKPVLALDARAGRLATAGGDGRIRVWDSESWGLIEEFQNPFGPIWALAFSGDGTALYYGGLDDVIHVWQVTPRRPFEAVASSFPRRFQIQTDSDDPVERGRVQFARKCSVCHTLIPDDGNRAGPTLHGVFGRRIASVPGYHYSDPLKDLDIVWTPETVSKLFELGPDVYTPGSKMPLQKMTDAQQRDDLIAFLKQATQPE